jgi:hypothetical protein
MKNETWLKLVNHVVSANPVFLVMAAAVLTSLTLALILL